jgi:hypothetical protein
MMRSRQLGTAREGSGKELPATDPTAGTPAISTDSEMAEIEAILRKRGIS